MGIKCYHFAAFMSVMIGAFNIYLFFNAAYWVKIGREWCCTYCLSDPDQKKLAAEGSSIGICATLAKFLMLSLPIVATCLSVGSFFVAPTQAKDFFGIVMMLCAVQLFLAPVFCCCSGNCGNAASEGEVFALGGVSMIFSPMVLGQLACVACAFNDIKSEEPVVVIVTPQYQGDAEKV